ncbi:hypothetical protein ACN4EE_08725 [Geminocystis sp. CENA526]|uniref:hypothetical protein n=1 Tax=Geminocystis sp. CENA526 TaxID=1355871 RepID=UPI003D6F44E9
MEWKLNNLVKSDCHCEARSNLKQSLTSNLSILLNLDSYSLFLDRNFFVIDRKSLLSSKLRRI